MDTLQKQNKKKEIKGGLGADAIPACKKHYKQTAPQKPQCVCVCVLHALIALAHHDAAQNADNEPTLWFPEGAIYTTYYMHQIEHVLLAGKGVNIKSHKLREKKKNNEPRGRMLEK